MMSEKEIEELKNDPQFQENLKLLEKEMREQESIAKGYQLLDAKLVTGADEDDINEIFTFIVNKAFDNLAQVLSERGKLDLSNPEEWATARAIYEHGIQRYSENDLKGAKEIFLALHHIIEHKEISDAMMIHAAALMAGHSFDSFIENIADVSDYDVTADEASAFFITTFTQPTDILMQLFAKEVKEGKELLSKL